MEALAPHTNELFDQVAQLDMIIGKIWKLTRKINTKIEPFLSEIENLEKTILNIPKALMSGQLSET